MGRQARCIIFFIMATLVGMAAGVAYGWEINPVQYEDTRLDSLRVDYKTDVVLMIAELYNSERDIGLALSRLTGLGEVLPEDIMKEAIHFAECNHYEPEDIQFMQQLFSAIENIPSKAQ